MAVGHIAFDHNSFYGNQLTAALAQLDAGVKAMKNLRGTMVQMLNSGVADAYIQTKFGCPDIPTAQAMFTEVDTLYAKLVSDASVLNLATELQQIQDKLR